MSATQKTINQSVDSQWKNKEWNLRGDDLIYCKATKETVDKESCHSANRGEGCMYMKNGKCTYGAENND